MEGTSLQPEPEISNRISDSAARLGVTLARQQLEITQDSYQRRYEQGVTNLWESQIHISQGTGEELAALRLEAQRQFALTVVRTVLMMGVPCSAIAWWTFGVAVSVLIFVSSVFLGMYFGAK